MQVPQVRMNVVQQGITVINAPTTVEQHMNKSCVKGLGITVTVLGAMLIIFGIVVALLAHGSDRRFFTGIWGGILVVIAGILGIYTSKKPANKTLVGCSLAFQVIICVTSVIYMFMFGASLGYYRQCKISSTYNHYATSHDSYSCDTTIYVKPIAACRNRESVTGLYGWTIFLCAVTWWVVLFAAICHCRAVCGCLECIRRNGYCGENAGGVVVMTNYPQQAAVINTQTGVVNGMMPPQYVQQVPMIQTTQYQNQYPNRQMGGMQQTGMQYQMGMQPPMQVGQAYPQQQAYNYPGPSGPPDQGPPGYATLDPIKQEGGPSNPPV